MNHIGTPENKSVLSKKADWQPGSLGVIKRNNAMVHFEKNKIAIAVTKAFLAVEGEGAKTSNRIHEKVEKLTAQIVQTLQKKLPNGGMLHIEDIQDQVELALMCAGEHKVARAYVLYREERTKNRHEARKRQQKLVIHVTNQNGERTPLDIEKLQALVDEACMDLEDVKPEALIEDALHNLYDGVAKQEVIRALIMSTRAWVEREPNYSYVAARLLLDELRQEALPFLGLASQPSQKAMNSYYPTCLVAFIRKGIELEHLDPRLETFNLQKLGEAICGERDQQFTFLGLQTLYDRYFLHHQEIRFELPQVFFMRVAMGLALNEREKEEKAILFYHVLSSFDFMSSTPTLFNSGTLRSQLSSCYLTTVPDDLTGIYGALQDNALLSKYAGGLGNDWTPVRAMGAHIKGTNGKSQGVVPFLKVASDTAVAVNQGGKRKGAVCAYLETWHLDIEDFLELRKNTGDDRRRTHDMNTANWIPDLFMKRVIKQKDWTLFSPDEVPALHDLTGDLFEKAYVSYEAKAAQGGIKLFKVVPATHLWRKMLTMLYETGHPWITFKDPCNLRSPQQHVGAIHSSNLCTEITLNTSSEEIAVCNLGSINLATHMERQTLNHSKLQKTIETAIRMLDNVIDINYYSVQKARHSNLKHRPIGLGIMGFQDALYKLNIPYASDEAVLFADRSMEEISYYAILASTELAKERGAYETFKGSLWSQGILPIDSIVLLAKNREGYTHEPDCRSTLDWEPLRERVKQDGMRNSNCLAIAPTATISNICGVSQSIEPTYQNLFVKSNLSGEFTVINPYLVQELKRHNLWDEVMVHDLKYYNGSVQKITRIPEDIKQRFKTAFEIDPTWLIEAASRRQKWIDQAQSLNLYMAEASGKKLDALYRLAWQKGLKTTYYLRSLGATSTEKATLEDSSLNKVACSMTDASCEVCQ
ncbi:MAG: ribonucleoside-diphosphate reductase subunit alpha [Gammaproteobacteria bacterium]|nr:ribonucleoside-diphosphate reductase subunit alpha [Gammaproteobacteria bacterium]